MKPIPQQLTQPRRLHDWADNEARDLLRAMFAAAVKAADPAYVLAQHLPERPVGRCIVVGAGKAAASMAAAVDSVWPEVDVSGAVVAPYGYGGDAGRIVVLEASHPIPDEASEVAAHKMLQLVRGLTTDDLVLGLISGGGSAVLALPADGLTLADKQAINRVLLASGLDIRSMNAVRRRLSAIKGGKLAEAAAPARVVTLAISDIPGDDIAAIASGPTVPDPDASRDLTALALQLRDHISAQVYERLVAPVFPGKSSPAVDARLIATPGASLAAAAEVARQAGLEVVMLGDNLEGESRELAAQMAERIARHRGAPLVMLSGGETTVTLAGQSAGRGGRNTEFALALAIALEGKAGVWALAADTDGEDGTSGGGAGAIVAPDTAERASAAGLDLRAYLERHDSGSLFAAIGDMFVTGPTRTNVNDFRAVLVVPT